MHSAVSRWRRGLSRFLKTQEQERQVPSQRLSVLQLFKRARREALLVGTNKVEAVGGFRTILQCLGRSHRDSPRRPTQPADLSAAAPSLSSQGAESRRSGDGLMLTLPTSPGSTMIAWLLHRMKCVFWDAQMG
ncbi:hypothetical protein DPSP01_008273 [Paraphaeosphaeria sporulosa]